MDAHHIRVPFPITPQSDKHPSFWLKGPYSLYSFILQCFDCCKCFWEWVVGWNRLPIDVVDANPWGLSRQGWIRPWATLSSCACPCSFQGSWTRWPLKVLPTLWILCFYLFPWGDAPSTSTTAVSELLFYQLQKQPIATINSLPALCFLLSYVLSCCKLLIWNPNWVTLIHPKPRHFFFLSDINGGM